MIWIFLLSLNQKLKIKSKLLVLNDNMMLEKTFM